MRTKTWLLKENVYSNRADHQQHCCNHTLCHTHHTPISLQHICIGRYPLLTFFPPPPFASDNFLLPPPAPPPTASPAFALTPACCLA